MSIVFKLEPVFRWRVSIQTSFEIFKYLIKKKNLFIYDRKIRCDTYIWTEIDLDSYVRNYYVNRQVRAVFQVTHINPNRIDNPDLHLKFSNI